MRWDGHVKTNCTVSGCGRPMLARGWCAAHYQRKRKTGKIDPHIPISKVRLLERNSNWKGGQTNGGHGRVCLYRPEHPSANPWGYVYRYRIVAEGIIGRYLKKGEVVHHLDGNPSNDHPSNLEVTTQSKHVKAHTADMHNEKWLQSVLLRKRNRKGQYI